MDEKEEIIKHVTKVYDELAKGVIFILILQLITLLVMIWR